jgi:hypothetical protein
MQPPQFLDDEGFDVAAIGVRDDARDPLPDGIEWIGVGMRDDLPHRLLDHLAVGKPQRIGFGQVLLDGEVFLRRAFVGPQVLPAV